MRIHRQTTLHNGKAPFLPALIGTGFGAGYWPWGPGTAGALVATLMWYGLSALVPAAWMMLVTVALVLMFQVAGIWAANRLAPCWGEDPSRVVVDEMVGVWIALLAAPAMSWGYALAAFVLFRFFDMVKPFGVRHMEKMGGGVGVMMDDVLAGIYSFLLLYVARYAILPLCAF